MKILIITAVFPPEPVVSARLSFDIAHKLSDSHNVTVISPRPTRPLGFQFASQVNNHKFSHIISDSYTCSKSDLLGRFRESLSFGSYCSNYIRKNHSEIDTVYLNSWPLLSQYLIIRECKKYKLKSIVHIQDVYPESFTNKLKFGKGVLNRLLMNLDKYILKNSYKIIAISDQMKQYLVKTRKVQVSKFITVHNWQDDSSFLGIPSTTSDSKFTFMYLGNIGPVAGVDLLVDVFVELQNLNCRLIIAGAGTMKESLEKRVYDIKCNNISFYNVPEGMVAQTQATTDVLLLPVVKGSALSSVPSKLPAYMFSCKPIIAAVDKNSATAEAIIMANCGWVVEPSSKEKLQSVVLEAMASEKEKLNEFGNNGYNYAIMNYSRKENLSKVIDVILN